MKKILLKVVSFLGFAVGFVIAMAIVRMIGSLL